MYEDKARAEEIYWENMRNPVYENGIRTFIPQDTVMGFDLTVESTRSEIGRKIYAAGATGACTTVVPFYWAILPEIACGVTAKRQYNYLRDESTHQYMLGAISEAEHSNNLKFAKITTVCTAGGGLLALATAGWGILLSMVCA